MDLCSQIASLRYLFGRNCLKRPDVGINTGRLNITISSTFLAKSTVAFVGEAQSHISALVVMLDRIIGTSNPNKRHFLILY